MNWLMGQEWYVYVAVIVELLSLLTVAALVLRRWENRKFLREYEQREAAKRGKAEK